MSQKKIDKLQSQLIDNQELSTQKLLESAESLAKVSDVVKAEVNEVVTERKRHMQMFRQSKSLWN